MTTASTLLLILLSTAAPAAESEGELPSILTISPALSDAGIVEPGAVVEVPVLLRSTQGPEVVVSSVEIFPDGGDSGFGFDGALPAIAEGGEDTVVLTFEATRPGRHSAELVVGSDAACTQPLPVLLRAFVVEPCLQGLPVEVDFGPVAIGDTADVLLSIAPCSGRPMALDAATVSSGDFAVVDPLPITVLAAGSLVRLRASPTTDQPQTATLALGLGPTSLGSIALRMNDCAGGDPSLCGGPAVAEWTDDDGDAFSEKDGDCDDNDDSVGPGAAELDNGLDDDCDGRADEHRDADGDGTPTPLDCDDTNPWVAPDADEVFDGLDNDCNGSVDDDGQATDSCPPWEDPDAKADGCGCTSSPGLPAVGTLFALTLALFRRRR